MTVVSNITLEIDGEKFVQRLNIPYKTSIKTKDYQSGSDSPSAVIR